jgi:hypothetical protein
MPRVPRSHARTIRQEVLAEDLTNRTWLFRDPACPYTIKHPGQFRKATRVVLTSHKLSLKAGSKARARTGCLNTGLTRLKCFCQDRPDALVQARRLTLQVSVGVNNI